MSLNDTPRANRLHIGLFGKRNSGKSSLVNALTGQQVATVSAVPGTTTDPVYKAMELHGIGPVVFIDTAGFDDEGELGALRVGRTEQAAKETDIALVLFSDEDMAGECAWIKRLQGAKTPVVAVVSRADVLADGGQDLVQKIEEQAGFTPIVVSAVEKSGLDALRAEIIRQLPEDYEAESITAGLCEPGDTVLLVMPQDIQAPKGRLILPQVQTLRELLDRHCHVLCCTTDELTATLALLKAPPQLIITDSQAFRSVHAQKPAASRLTSFSVLFAGYKGDIAYFTSSARKLLELPAEAHILIAEACTHRPLTEDIGRVKLPRLLRKRLGEKITITMTAGRDFPQDLRQAGIDFVIHCGACMFNRKYVLSRVAECRGQGVPMSNYGIAIAALLGILDDVEMPGRRN
ncbi:[FeFe] hydrogenase H-cluster maturation GTPase HydF [Selenomonas sp. GACV-9]|uniref:[FeFe] hydrogenase H-cluster maturation GTPase HydF n=1 Tax=Selenomonas sp. GACV-9 TaxID=3158782 RepID=UPI0008EC70FD|nr:[FeFe] hydrogenase H-cluster maturation GTPase HydF [Selenomonas ruminantium]